MLTEIYIEALLVAEELADQVWEAWDAGRLMILLWPSFGGGFALRHRAPIVLLTQSARKRLEPTDAAQFFQARNDCRTD